MSDQQNEIRRKLLAVFREEAQEHLRALGVGMIELENADIPQRTDILEGLFRAAHNFKGASRAVGYTAVESICQKLESVLAMWKERTSAPGGEQFDVVHRSLDTIRELLSMDEIRSDDPRVTRTTAQLSKLLRPPAGDDAAITNKENEKRQTRRRAAKKRTGSPVKTSVPEPGALRGTVRISSEQLDRLLRESEELLSARSSMERTVQDLQKISELVGNWKHEFKNAETSITHHPEDTAHPEKEAREKYVDLLEWSRARIDDIYGAINMATASVRERNAAVGLMVNRHLDNMKTASLLPFSMLTDSFPRITRDLLRRHGKDARLEISGDDIEVDRRILQELKDPLIHLLRNAIDHGLEHPEERTRAGKKSSGAIRFHVERLDSSRLRIEIADDGSGIDSRNVGRAAVSKKLVSPEEVGRMGTEERTNLIFRSGLSTKSDITEISGRGLGMAIVREAVERLSGQVWVESSVGTGTTFRIDIPSTVATLRALQIRLGDRHFMIPTAFAETALRISPEMIRTIEDRETIRVHDETVALLDLGSVLGLGAARKWDEALKHTLILRSSNRRIALMVDQIVDEGEVLVKGLGPQLERVRMIAGGTISGDGEVVPMLNISDLLGFEHLSQPARYQMAEEDSVADVNRKTILVVEDSITSRTLLKSILESSGFAVKTAIDGAEAFALLKTEHFDLVVSDIDMPRMNGIDLTEKIRADSELSDLPVVLVTALESREDRERGIEAGAGAYVVKSKFDNANLIQTIRRLV